MLLSVGMFLLLNKDFCPQNQLTMQKNCCICLSSIFQISVDLGRSAEDFPVTGGTENAVLAAATSGNIK